MELLRRIQVSSPGGTRAIELYHGDLTRLPEDVTVDYLVVSAFPDDYLPTPDSLVGALYRAGIDMEALARSKAVDLRETCSCWLSGQIEVSRPGIRFSRILCFEPLVRGTPPAVVGDVFRSLIPFVAADSGPVTVAMPLLASHNQGADPGEMLAAIVDAARHWMGQGLPIERLIIVEWRPDVAARLATLIDRLDAAPGKRAIEAPQSGVHDVFLSYAREDQREADLLHESMLQARPTVRVFVDRLELDPGCAWQQQIFDAIDAARSAVVVYSPDYLRSDFCKEEFNIALLRHREAAMQVFPVYAYTADLPSYMRALVQHIDCREGDAALLRSAGRRVATALA